MSAVVVGYDGSDTARIAVDEAVKLARGLEIPLHVIWVIDEKAAHSDVANVWTLDHLDDQLAERNAAIAENASEHLHELTSHFDGLEISSAAVGGHPAQVLVEEAERVGASIIVVGNKNAQGLRRVLGSIAADVVKHAPCNVYVAKTT